MSIIRPCPDAARPARGGFTFLELLLALTLSGVLVTVLFRMINGNSEFVGRQSAQQEVQQTARSTLDLIAADLRSAPPQGIVEMLPGSVRFYAARAAGVLCNPLTTSSTVAWVLFPSDVFPSDSVINRRSWGIAVEQTADAAVPTGSWRFVPQVARSSSADPCAAVQPSLSTSHTRIGFAAGAGAFVASGTVPVATQVLLYEEVRYDVAASTTPGLTGTWLRRMAGYGASGQPNMQPVAGPVPTTGALTFTYLQGDGVTPATTASQVRRIQIRIVAQSAMMRAAGGGSRAPVAVDTLSTDVFLRN